MFKKRKPAEPEEIKNPPWVATFCDMVLLMISFFIILIAFSTFKVGRVVQFVSGFQGSFKVLPGGYKTDKGDQVIIPYQDIAKTYRDPGEILSGLKKNLDEAAATQGLERQVKVSLTERGVVLDISNAVLFRVGSADINPTAFPLLSKIGDEIRKSSFPIGIEGHTDNLPIKTERFPSNWELSATRAVNVLRYFLEIKRVLPQRLFAVGYGKHQPLVPNDSPENRAKNRRVVIIFSKESAGEREDA